MHWVAAGPTDESAEASRHGGAYQEALIVPGGAIGFSVAAYCVCALVAVGGLGFQRLAWGEGAELGGTRFAACGTASFLFAVWVAYACAVTLNRSHAGVLSRS